MGFDVQNFGLGVLAGWASAYGVYRARKLISAATDSAREGASQARSSATRSSDSRYVHDLVDLIERRHLAGGASRLSELLIEPRFIPRDRLMVPPGEEDLLVSVLDNLPKVHDHPYLHAPYHIETLSVDELTTGDRALALLGLPGSGRTTALLTIALRALGKIDFDTHDDKIQQQLDQEEASLTEKDRAVRVKERIVIEQRAQEQLANERRQKFDTEGDAAASDETPLLGEFFPVYVHMADLNFASRGEYNADVDPAEPIVRAVQYNVGRVTASTIPRFLYTRLNRGQALLLIDGYDDLPEAERPTARAWLKALLNQYRANFIIVAGPAQGYGALTDLGMTPIFMRPWSMVDIEQAAEKWAQAWPFIGRTGGRAGRRTAPVPEAASITRAQSNSRALSPFDFTLKVWANYADDATQAGFEGWLRGYLARHLPADRALDDILPQIIQLGVVQIEDGYITSARLQALAAAEASADGASDPSAAEAAGAESAGDEAAKPARGRRGRADRAAAQNGAQADQADNGEDSETATPQGRLLGDLRRSGLLLRFRGDRYQFRHPNLAAYLASLSLIDAAPEDLQARAEQAAWRQVFVYAGMNVPLDDIVRERTTAPFDIMSNNVTELARWLAYASTDVPWRGDLLRQLGVLLLSPNQYPHVRERAVAALITARDKSVTRLLRQAVRNADPAIRRLGCLGLGAVGDPEVISDLIALLRQDPTETVQLAAGLALSAIGTGDALNAMVEAFSGGSDVMRQAMAEAFAGLPDEGHPILNDAIVHEEMELRRAAIFGLRRINTTWALIAIYRAFLDDAEWYVRSAAQEAFEQIQYGRRESYTRALPTVDTLEWLKDWAAQQGENLPSGDGANQMLLRALQEGDAETRTLAAANLGQLGMLDTSRLLYAALRDRQDEVRAAAHESLARLQAQMGKPLPSPN
ncbi:MAG: HEAT repeat domain-containing protein [Chloroflexi bacterium]|nr:HEAT repeat domain-containing protein [Chloroflexota bacterium]